MNGLEESHRKSHYVLLFTQSLKQWNVTETLRRALPDEQGEVFYPCVELWWHGENTTKYKALFPGYVFIRSGMEMADLHNFIRQERRDILSFVRELGISEKRLGGEDAFANDGIIDLTDEESEFFDLLLGFKFDADLDRRREAAKKAGKLYLAPERDGEMSGVDGKPLHSAASGELDRDGASSIYTKQDAFREEYERRRKKHIPEKGVVQISFGYREQGRIVVMDGPLFGKEDYIRDYKAKDQKAYLSVMVAGRPVKAGLILLGKRVWFPDDKDAPVLLADDTEVDCKKLSRMMLGGGR